MCRRWLLFVGVLVTRDGKAAALESCINIGCIKEDLLKYVKDRHPVLLNFHDTNEKSDYVTLLAIYIFPGEGLCDVVGCDVGLFGSVFILIG